MFSASEDSRHGMCAMWDSGYGANRKLDTSLSRYRLAQCCLVAVFFLLRGWLVIIRVFFENLLLIRLVLELFCSC